MARLGATTQTDRSFLFRVSDDFAVAENTHEWCAPGVRPQIEELRHVPTAAFPWMLERLRGGEPLLLARVADLPVEADTEKRLMQSGGVLSAIFVPIRHAGKLVGFIGCDAVRAERVWSDQDAALLRTTGELITDTLARLQAAEALRASEEQHRSVVANSMDAVMLATKDGRILAANPAACKMFGRSEPEMLRAGRAGLVDSSDPRLQPALEERDRTGRFYGELTFVRGDGSKFPGEIASSLFDLPGGESRVSIVIRDVTERRQAEEALRESEERFRSFFELSADLVCIADVDGRFRRVNKTFTTVLGYAETELLSRPFIDFIHPDDKDKTRQVIEEKLKLGKTVLRFENRYLCKDGGVVWVEWSSNPSPARDCVFAMARDITERKEAERALAVSQRRLFTLMSNLPGIAYRCKNDADWTMEFISQGCFDLTGYQPEDLVQNRRRSFAGIIHPDDRQKVQDEVQGALLRQQHYQITYRIVTASGEVKWVWEQGRGVMGADGSVEALEGFISDITVRHRAEEALRASEDRYRTLAEAAHDMIFMVDRDDRVRYLNSFAARAIGRKPEEVVGRARGDLFPTAAGARQREHLERVFATGQPFYVEDSFPSAMGEMMIGTWLSPVLSPDGRVDVVLGISRDITERLQAEQAIHESYTLLRSVIESTHDPVYVKDEEGRYVLANSALAAAYGVPPEQIIGKTAAQLVPPAAAATMAAEDRTVLAENRSRTFEEYFTFKDGVTRFYLNNKTPLRDEQGNVIGIVGVAHDITDRKLAEEALKESEARFRAVLDNSLDVVHRRDLRTNRYDLITPAVESLTGFAPTELLGKGIEAILDRIHPEDQDRAKEIVARLEKGEATAAQAEYRFKHKDGSYRWVADRVTVLKDDQGQPQYLVGVARDVTEQYRLQEALDASAKRFRQIVETAAEGIWMVDARWKIVYANAQMERMLGYAPGEMEGRHVFEFMDEETRQFVRAKMAEREAGVRDVYDLRLRRKDGTAVWTMASANPIREASGAFAGALEMLTDITERRKAEKALHESEARNRAILSAIPDMMFILNEDNVFVDYHAANPGNLYVPPEQFMGRRVDEVLPPELARQVFEARAQVEQTGQMTMFEHSLDMQGQKHEFEARVVAVGDDQLMCIVRDITARKAAETALKESEARSRHLASMLENASQPFAVGYPDGRLGVTNSAFCALTGYSQSELQAIDWNLELTPPEWRDVEEKHLNELRRTGKPVRYEKEYLRKDGSRVPIELHVNLVRDSAGAPEYYYAFVTDLSERRQAQKALEHSEKLYRASVEAAGAVPYARDFATNRYEFIGAGIKALTGYEPAECTPDLWHRIIQEGVPTGEFAGMTHEAAMNRFQKERLAAWTCDYRIRCKDGGDRWVACAAVDVRDSEGRSVRSIGMLQDISLRKRAETALREAHDLLEKRVAERTAQLSKEINEREHAEAALRQLSGRLLELQDEERRRMGRELHDTTAQTLAAISINLSLIHKQAAKLAPETRHILSECMDLARQCSQEIRTMSYLLHPPLLDEFGLVSALRWYADGFAKRSGVRLELDLPSGGERFSRETEITIFRIAQEALTNIHRHSGSAVARIQLAVTGSEVTLRVQDQGRGMPPRSPEDSRTRIGRLGVGISGMRERVRQLGGHLDIQSGSQGTTITVTLPLTKATS